MKTTSQIAFVVVLALFSSRAISADYNAGVSREKSASQAASAAFREFVANLKIVGVFLGTPSRIMVDKRVIGVGEVVDAALGIRFHSVDRDAKIIVFEDGSGARVSKSFAR